MCTGGDPPGSHGGFTRGPIGCRVIRPTVILTGRFCGMLGGGGPVAPLAPCAAPPPVPRSVSRDPLKLRCHRCHLPQFAQCLTAFRRPLFGAICPGRCQMAPCRTILFSVTCNRMALCAVLPRLRCGVRYERGPRNDHLLPAATPSLRLRHGPTSMTATRTSSRTSYLSRGQAVRVSVPGSSWGT